MESLNENQLSFTCAGDRRFGIGTTEFSPMGLLPVIAKGVDVSIPVAGMLISAYAIGVMVGAPLMTLLLSHRARRNALIFLMGIFTVGNLLSSIAPDYTTLLLSRIITSLNHGAFFGLGSVVAASVVPKHKQASAVATMFMGLTIANIGGVPAATWLGETIGWRMSFLATAGLGLLAMVSLWFSLPKGSAGERPDVKKELSVLLRPQVLSALLTTVLGAGAMFTLYTYISPVLNTLTHASSLFITAMLVLIGVGFRWATIWAANLLTVGLRHAEGLSAAADGDHAGDPAAGAIPDRGGHQHDCLGRSNLCGGSAAADAGYARSA